MRAARAARCGRHGRRRSSLRRCRRRRSCSGAGRRDRRRLFVPRSRISRVAGAGARRARRPPFASPSAVPSETLPMIPTLSGAPPVGGTPPSAAPRRRHPAPPLVAPSPVIPRCLGAPAGGSLLSAPRPRLLLAPPATSWRPSAVPGGPLCSVAPATPYPSDVPRRPRRRLGASLRPLGDPPTAPGGRRPPAAASPGSGLPLAAPVSRIVRSCSPDR